MPRAKRAKQTAGEKWLRQLRSTQALNAEQAQLALIAAEQLNALEMAKEELKENGTMVRGKFGPRANPALNLIRVSGAAFARLLKQIKEAGEVKRPPHRPSANDKLWLQQQEAEAAKTGDQWAEFKLPQ